MRYLFYLLTSLSLLLTSSSCHLRWNFYGIGEMEPKIDGSEITHAMQHYIAYLRHAKHLRLEDSGVFYFDSIHTVRMEFISMDVMELCEARELMVDVVEGLLYELNRNPILASQFIDYPLASPNLEIFIRFETYEGVYVDPYYVGWMSLVHDLVTFYAFDIKIPNENLWDYRVEPYFKSREFVLYGREAEQLFKMSFEMDFPSCLKKEQYCPEERHKPRYYSPYTNQHSYDTSHL
jgi:hypothetical protein